MSTKLLSCKYKPLTSHSSFWKLLLFDWKEKFFTVLNLNFRKTVTALEEVELSLMTQVWSTKVCHKMTEINVRQPFLNSSDGQKICFCTLRTLSLLRWKRKCNTSKNFTHFTRNTVQKKWKVGISKVKRMRTKSRTDRQSKLITYWITIK